MDRHAHWQHILDHLSGYPVYERDGVEVFRYSEVGQDWEDGSCMVGLQHIYPADTLDLDSDPKLLETAKNTITAHYWGWDDNNHTMSFMPAAARVGYDPETILRNLREKSLSPEHAQPNLYLKYGGGGIEACSTVTATLQEMLLQSCRGTVRVFADWPKARDAAFTDLRAYGAFLISAKLSGGIVQSVRVVSEKGRPLTLINPWPGQAVRLTREGAGLCWTASGSRCQRSRERPCVSPPRHQTNRHCTRRDINGMPRRAVGAERGDTFEPEKFLSRRGSGVVAGAPLLAWDLNSNRVRLRTAGAGPAAPTAGRRRAGTKRSTL